MENRNNPLLVFEIGGTFCTVSEIVTANGGQYSLREHQLTTLDFKPGTALTD